MAKDNGRRPGRNFRIATQSKGRFASLMDEQMSVTAIATCKITIKGSGGAGKVKTRMQTFGGEFIGYWLDKDYVLTTQGQWSSFDGERILSDLLVCLSEDLTVNDFYNFYGKPEKGKSYVVDFVDVVVDLAPELLETSESQVI